MVTCGDQDDVEDVNVSDDEGITIDGIYIPAPLRPSQATDASNRLIITKITNNFFKSYAEECVLGPFSKCFNAIVGPNGSGKSNVIDSMLFVFGYRATKIRSKKLSVLIHNSENYHNVNSCTVAVHFCQIVDTDNGYDIVPGSQFVISRTAHKDNSSFYQINSHRVQFKEVAKLLRTHGVDLDHNRFLILQGEVEEIAMMKCKGANENETGMLEYLEDIIGTMRYKKSLVQLNERIEHLSEMRLEKINRLKLIEKELNDLKGPMEEAMGFLKTENKIASCKNFLYQRYLCDLEDQAKEIEEDLTKITESRNRLIEELKVLSEEKSSKEKQLKKESAAYEKMQQKKDELKEAFNVADKKDVQLQAEMVQINTSRKKNKQLLEEERKKLAKLETVPEENKKSIAECENKEVELTAKKEQLEIQKSNLLSTIREETKDLQAEKEQLVPTLGTLKKTVDSTKSKFDLATAELNLAQSNEETEKRKLEQFREELENREAVIQQRTRDVTELEKKVPLTEKSLQGAQREFEAAKTEESQLLNDVRINRVQLEESRASMQMSKSRNRVLDALTQQKHEGNCPGLYGRLGDLGSIDLKYDVAVSTACGPLDNIVVDSVTTAQWCIEFLKEHGIGRATFISLEKQEHFRPLADKKISTPENVHRLFDLIKVQDDRVRTAFYFGLRDTLVTEDLDQATRIAYGAKRYRVVTLKGDLIETSGTMSGGGKSVSRGRMGQTIVAALNPKEIEKTQRNIEKSENRLRILTQTLTSLGSQINTLQPELTQMKMNLAKHTRELKSLKEQQPILVQQLRKQEKTVQSTKSDAKQIKHLTSVVERSKAEYDEASAAAQELQVEVDKLTEQIKEKTTGKVKVVDKSLNEVSKTIDKCKTEITKLKVAITTSTRNAKKSADKIVTLEREINEAENKIRTMKSEREVIESDAQKLLKCIEELASQLSNGEEAYAGLKSEVAGIKEEEKKMLLQKVDVDQTFKAIKEKLDECKSSCHQWHAKLVQLKVHDIPEEPTELAKFSPEELKARNKEAVELELHASQNSIKNSKPNLKVIEEHRLTQNVYVQRADELLEVTSKRDSIKSKFDEVTQQRKDEFMVGFNVIRLKLKEMYQMITLGGDADFEIVDSFDPFLEGIQLNVRPPKKSWKNISNLSGGEKTLSSLALVFALHYYKPSPLYVMDEIDAALDFKNVSIVAHYIKERTKNAQFIIISLRSNMFELADNMIGIYKIFNCTHTITVDPTAFDRGKENRLVNAKEQEQSRKSQEITTVPGRNMDGPTINNKTTHSLEDMDVD